MNYKDALFMLLRLLALSQSYLKGSTKSTHSQKRRSLKLVRKTTELLYLWIADIDNSAVEFPFVDSLDLLNLRLKNAGLQQVPHPFILFQEMEADSSYNEIC
jgi:hypothetical protein